MCTVRNSSRLVGGGGVCSGGVVSQHALRQTPPVDRQTPVKTTFATSLRTVKIYFETKVLKQQLCKASVSEKRDRV